MKLYAMLLLIAFQVGDLNAQQPDREPYQSKSFANKNIRNVNVKTSGGSIEINGNTPPGQIRVDVYVNPNNGRSGRLSKEEIAERLQNYNLNVSMSGQELTAEAKPKHGNMNWRDALSISFKVYVPKDVASNLSTSGGSIRLANLNGEQNFSTSGGSLNVEHVTGGIHGRTSGGSISVSNSGRDIDLETSGGSITARNCTGNINLKTSGGSLQLDQLDGQIEARTSGGSIRGQGIRGELKTGTSGGSVNLSQLACSLDVSNSAGSIHAELKDLGKYVRIRSSAGHADVAIPGGKGVDLDLRGSKINTNALKNFSGSQQKDWLKGKLNGGGIPVEISTSAGSISLTVN